MAFLLIGLIVGLLVGFFAGKVAGLASIGKWLDSLTPAQCEKASAYLRNKVSDNYARSLRHS